jgi:hypothetical protein
VSVKFRGRKVFLALRPFIFEHVDNQHVTLEYLGDDIEWNSLVERANHWSEVFGNFDLPVEVAVNGYANWIATNNKVDRYFDVALVEFPGFPATNFLKNWHITLGMDTKPIKARSFNREVDQHHRDYVGQLWIGYTDENGGKCWVTFHGIHTQLNDNKRAVPL